jgi:hypothetical protein
MRNERGTQVGANLNTPLAVSRAWRIKEASLFSGGGAAFVFRCLPALAFVVCLGFSATVFLDLAPEDLSFFKDFGGAMKLSPDARIP